MIIMAQVKIDCSRKTEDNGSFALIFACPPPSGEGDSIAFTGARELTYHTARRDMVENVRPGGDEDVFYLALIKGNPTVKNL